MSFSQKIKLVLFSSLLLLGCSSNNGTSSTISEDNHLSDTSISSSILVESEDKEDTEDYSDYSMSEEITIEVESSSNEFSESVETSSEGIISAIESSPEVISSEEISSEEPSEQDSEMETSGGQADLPWF